MFLNREGTQIEWGLQAVTEHFSSELLGLVQCVLSFANRRAKDLRLLEEGVVKGYRVSGHRNQEGCLSCAIEEGQAEGRKQRKQGGLHHDPVSIWKTKDQAGGKGKKQSLCCEANVNNAVWSTQACSQSRRQEASV